VTHGDVTIEDLNIDVSQAGGAGGLDVQGSGDAVADLGIARIGRRN